MLLDASQVTIVLQQRAPLIAIVRYSLSEIQIDPLAVALLGDHLVGIWKGL